MSPRSPQARFMSGVSKPVVLPVVRSCHRNSGITFSIQVQQATHFEALRFVKHSRARRATASLLQTLFGRLYSPNARTACRSPMMDWSDRAEEKHLSTDADFRDSYICYNMVGAAVTSHLCPAVCSGALYLFQGRFGF